MSSLGFSIRKIESRWKDRLIFIKSLFKKDFFALGFIVVLSVTLIADKGLANYRYSENISENKIEKYIDVEKISSLLLNRVQSAEISNRSSFVSLDGHGSNDNRINTIQQTALLAFNSLENDLSSLKDGGNNQNNQIAIYTVQEGDTLSFIASDFGVSMDTIIWANNLNNIHSLKPGDELKIPPIDGVIHKVKKGDSVRSIAKKYGADEEKIIAFNVLPKDGAIQIDEEIMVPDGKITAPTPKSNGSMAKSASSIIKRFAYLPSFFCNSTHYLFYDWLFPSLCRIQAFRFEGFC